MEYLLNTLQDFSFITLAHKDFEALHHFIIVQLKRLTLQLGGGSGQLLCEEADGAEDALDIYEGEGSHMLHSMLHVLPHQITMLVNECDA